LGYSELRQKADSCSIYSSIEISVLNERYTRKNVEEIRRNLEDGFKGHFDGKLKHLTSVYGEESKEVTDAKSMETILRKRLTNDALYALCAFGDSADLKVVRTIADKSESDFSEPVLRFLGRFGDWSDKDRILSLWNKDLISRSFLSIRPKVHAKAVAAALHAIGKHVLVELLTLETGDEIRRELVSEMTQREIADLSGDILLAQLNGRDGTIRKMLALKCVQALSRARIRKLLDQYVNIDEYRYYNTIHWLDLGASMPTQMAKTVAKSELAKLE
jgi:hypothetical protein